MSEQAVIVENAREIADNVGEISNAVVEIGRKNIVPTSVVGALVGAGLTVGTYLVVNKLRARRAERNLEALFETEAAIAEEASTMLSTSPKITEENLAETPVTTIKVPKPGPRPSTPANK